MKLTPENKAAWLEALDTHSKGKGSLVKMNTNYSSSYCCLGVAGKVLLGASDEDLEKQSHYLTEVYRCEMQGGIAFAFQANRTFLKEVLTQKITDNMDLSEYAANFYSAHLESNQHRPNSDTVERFLGYMNDRTDTFEEIKYVINTYL